MVTIGPVFANYLFFLPKKLLPEFERKFKLVRNNFGQKSTQNHNFAISNFLSEITILCHGSNH